MASPLSIELATELYRVRKEVQFAYGYRYEEIIAPAIEHIRKLRELYGISPIKFLTQVTKHPPADQAVSAVLVAAVVEVYERAERTSDK